MGRESIRLGFIPSDEWSITRVIALCLVKKAHLDCIALRKIACHNGESLREGQPMDTVEEDASSDAGGKCAYSKGGEL